MRFAIILKCDDILMHIPASWCSYIDIVGSMNNSLNKNIERTIFYSPDENRTPNFKLVPGMRFDEDIDGCYKAYILKVFATFDEAHAFIERKRNVRPAVYNPARPRQPVPPVDYDMDIKNVIKLELGPVQQALRYTNSLVGVQDLTQDDVDEFAEMFEIDDEDNANPANIDQDEAVEALPNEHDEFDDEVMVAVNDDTGVNQTENDSETLRINNINEVSFHSFQRYSCFFAHLNFALYSRWTVAVKMFRTLKVAVLLCLICTKMMVCLRKLTLMAQMR